MNKFRDISAFVVLALVATLAIGIGACEDDPIRRMAGPDLPDCWKPLDTSGGGIQSRTSTPQLQYGPAWSRSGEQIAYFSFFDSCNDLAFSLYIAEGPGARRIPLGIGGSTVRWMPDDTALLISGGVAGGSIAMYSLTDSSVTPLNISTRFPVFDVSKDGKFIYYIGDAAPPLSGSMLFQYSFETGERKPLVQGGLPAISNDGTRLAFSFGGLFVMDLTDSTVDSIAGGSYSDWGPNDDYLVFADGIGQIFVADLKGGIELLTGEPGPRGANGPLSLSQQTQQLLFRHSDGIAIQIWQIDIDGTNFKKFSY